MYKISLLLYRYLYSNKNGNQQWGRFLNTDNYISTASGILSHNMFAYANNNPIMNIDPDGKFVLTIAGFIAVTGIVTFVVSSLIRIHNLAKNNQLNTSNVVEQISYAAGDSLIVMSIGLVASQAYDTVKFYNSSSSKTPASSVPKTSLKGTQNPAVKAKVMQGQAIHKSWDYGSETSKEVRITPKYRVDAIDFNKSIIYELKPNNSVSITRGINQLNNYTRAASEKYGGDWTGILIKYDN